MFLFKETLDKTLCQEFPEALVVFGDNLIQKGTLFQAQIRYQKNSFGVPTKRLPSMDKNAFFSDQQDEYKIVKEKLVFLWEEHKKGRTIILPTKRIGSGLAKLEFKSPIINKLIIRFYESALKESC